MPAFLRSLKNKLRPDIFTPSCIGFSCDSLGKSGLRIALVMINCRQLGLHSKAGPTNWKLAQQLEALRRRD
ncbi:hypothetical protein SUGI_0651830 [Cryptomeria japonica]|nr:hypothetical protein SUGI_0651830 [Cryptomeria japonica]